MNRVLGLVILLLLTVTGCATVESTPTPQSSAPAPAQAQPNQVAPASAGTTTAPAVPPSKCQSKVTGSVKDAKGAVVKGATVEIKGGSFTAKTLTDDNGLYGFAGLCAGTFSFTVQVPGQAAKAVGSPVTINGNNTAKADLTVK